jgi:hypothetical protein
MGSLGANFVGHDKTTFHRKIFNDRFLGFPLEIIRKIQKNTVEYAFLPPGRYVARLIFPTQVINKCIKELLTF